MALSGKIQKNLKFYILGSLFVITCFIWISVFAKADTGFLEVNFFDVGQGDAMFIEIPGGTKILIDGGPDDKILSKLAKEMPFYDRSIDMIILTHPEKDHISGLLDVLKRYKVGYILWNGIVRNTPEYEEWKKVLQIEGTKVKIAQAGQRIRLGDNAFIDILAPIENLQGQEFKDSNNTSVVSRFVFGKNSFLFTGDMAKPEEDQLLAVEKSLLDSDVLKVGHHGSKTSTSENFLEAVSPEIGVIEVGKNNHYGHPTQEVLGRLIQYGVKIFRTDLDGDIRILSDGISLKAEIR